MNQVLQNQTITHFSTSSRFELLSRDYYLFRTNIKTNHILSPQIIDLDFNLDNNIKCKISKSNKTYSSSISNEKRKIAPKHKRNREECKKDKTVTATVKDILLKMSTDGNYLTKTRKLLWNSSSNQPWKLRRRCIKPSLKRDPNCVIVHLGTNDLRSNKDPETITKYFIDIGKNS